MGKHLIIGTTDYIRWADLSTLQNASLVSGQGVVEQFSVGLQNYAPLDEFGFGGVLPPLPAGHVPIIYLDAYDYDGGPPWTGGYDILFSGILLSVDGLDPSITGFTKISVSTPIKFLKMVVHSIVFYPDDNQQPTDTSRIRRLGVILGDQLPDWDMDTYVHADLDGNITYGKPAIPVLVTSDLADAFTNYPEMTVENIIRAIATDPGIFRDANYPVQARNWWIEGDFGRPSRPPDLGLQHTGDPLDGVVWYIHYQNVPVPDTSVDLRGAPDPDFPAAVFYEQGSTYTIDYTKVIRQINIAGPSQSPDGTYTYTPQPVSWVGGSETVTSRSGVTFKSSGTPGVWDTAASSGLADGLGGLYYDDMEVDCQLQEVYLEHDTFQRPDGPGAGGGLGVTNHNTQWLDLAAGSPMCIRHSHAASQYVVNPQTNLPSFAFGIVDCHGTNVFLRTHLAVNRRGMGLMFHFYDYYNYWIVRTESWGYSLYSVSGGAYSERAHINVDRADMDEIKVAVTSEGDSVPPGHHYVDAYLNNNQWAHVDDNYLWDQQFHGLSIDCNVNAEAFEGEFYDFQCTTFYTDRSFGMGDNDMTSRTPPHPVPTWALHTFGFIFNSDATVEICHDGLKIPHTDWYLPNMNDYQYNDRFSIQTVSYIDPDTRSKQRKAQWLKQPDGQGQWYLLIEFAPVTEPLGPDPDHHWFAQFCAKDLGAALSNCVAGMAYSNMFYAPGPPTYSALYGGNHLYPAAGILQNDIWSNYIKRQRVADGIFRAEAEPALTFNCVTMHHFQRGDFATITNKRAGWVQDESGDTRPTLICTSVQRVETAHGRIPGNTAFGMPKYKCTFGRYMYASDDPGRTHLLLPGTTQNYLYSGSLNDPQFDGMDFSLDQQVLSGLDDFGKRMEVQFMEQNQLGEVNAQFPTFTYNLPLSKGVLPQNLFKPGSKVVMRYRFTGPGGDGQWTNTAPFVTPARPATDRLSTMMWALGNGTDAFAANDISDEVPINQPCQIVGWAADLTDVPGDVEYEIQWCTAPARRANGVAAFTAISNTGVIKIINTPTPVNDGTFNDGFNKSDWHDQAFNLQQGDRLRVKLVSATTTATKGTFNLFLGALDVPFNQTAGTPAPGNANTDNTIVGADGQPLFSADGHRLDGG